jgi:exonuclease III
MRVITWNVHGAHENSPVWDYIFDKSPDIVLLQEVGAIPEKIKNVHDIISRRAIYKNGRQQRFSTSVLVKGRIIGELPLISEFEWVNRELEFFKGNLIGCKIELPNQNQINVVSVYSPAWPIEKTHYEGIDISHVKLKSNPDLWVTEILWSALKNARPKEELWVVGGDFNSSETFDKEWQIKNGIKFGIKSSGNREIIDRISDIGFTECLRRVR